LTDPLLEKILVASVGPLTAAIVGTLIIGLFVAWITRRAQDRRARFELRCQLVSEMTEAASALLYLTDHYRKVKDGALGEEAQLADVVPILHKQYSATRTAGTVLEARLRAYFDSDHARHHWHAAIDLLEMRYYHVLGHLTEKKRNLNAGALHTGLTAEELEDLRLIDRAYTERLDDAIQAVLIEPMSRTGS
jgi:hypothetical protein